MISKQILGFGLLSVAAVAAFSAAAVETDSSAERPDHWAFVPPERPQIPKVHNQAWVRNPIDAFVLARLEAEGITPSAETDKRALIRRLSLDLIGLPPTPAEVRQYVMDNRPEAYERLVDRLLGSPHYGEKWALLWLDLARYADSDGYEKDTVRPHAWRYRHGVISALNQDMPFDQFTIEQVAGDLLPHPSTEQKVASGFHRNTPTNREGGVDIEQFRYEQVVDRTNTVGTVWLGLTVGCAQCHDHKYDPIAQKDYYRLFAFFNNAEADNIDAPLAGETGPYLQGQPEYLKKRQALLDEYGLPELQWAWEKRMVEAADHPGKWTDWDHAYDALQKYVGWGYNGPRILRTSPARRTWKEQKELTDHFVRNYKRVISRERWEELKFQELWEKLRELDASFPALSQAQAMRESATRRKTHIHLRGSYKDLGIEVEPGTPAFLHPMPSDPGPSRLTLARWITSTENPLTARVTVNRLWQELFGRGIVRTSEDFGTQGKPPSHPELLDWLATEFVRRDWSMKQMIRLIVTSATYRQSSDARPDLGSRDPDNALLGRQLRFRLPAELIRDSALFASRLLYPVVGGRSVHPHQPAGVSELGYANSVKWEESQGKEQYRRGLYIHYQRTVPYPFLANFDVPGRTVTSCRRNRSNTPLQALNLLNDPVFFEAAQALAARILQEASGGFDERLGYAFQICLAREPRAAERKRLADYLQRQVRLLDDQSAETIFPADLPGVERIEAAAWVGLSSLLLNLDEFITRE